jgi:hypothetical protein
MPKDAFAHGTVMTLDEDLVGDSKPKLLILLLSVLSRYPAFGSPGLSFLSR